MLLQDIFFFQTTVLDNTHCAHPDSWWWVKGDGCDITFGLEHSPDNKWSGDVDLSDGKLQALHTKYIEHHKFVEGFGLADRKGRWSISFDCNALEKSANDDLVTIPASK